MIAVYPGSFDPTTYGHIDIIKRASKFVNMLIVAILENPIKKPLFTTKEREKHLKMLTKNMKNVKIKSFSGLLVDFAKENNATLIIRGLRAITDFEYEFQMALTNRELDENIETLLIPTSIQNLFISSSVVKEISKFKGDCSKLVPEIIKKDLEKKFYI